MLGPRTYPRLVQIDDLELFEIHVDQVELHIAADRDLSGAAISAVHRIKGVLARFSETHPDFATTLAPYPLLKREWPREIQAMIKAGRQAGVGPMAAAGSCIAEYVAKSLLDLSCQVIVEEGGDVFLASEVDRIVSIYTGETALSMQTGLCIPAALTPLGVCASSGKVGNSLSLGLADAAVVVARNTLLADTAATAMGNRIGRVRDVPSALDWVMQIDGVLGAAIIIDQHISTRGEAIKLVDRSAL